MESFYTLQGEGAFSGQAAWFIRLGGCDVGCHWCDVKESWNAEAHPMRSIASVVKEAAAAPARLAIITGGEPTMHHLGLLTSALQTAGFQTHIETSGTNPLTGEWNWITLSPKKFKAPLIEVANIADELKVVVYNKSDLQWAEQWAEHMKPDARLLLQPEWSKHDQALKFIVKYVKEHPQWAVSLQTHKMMRIP